MSVREEIPGYYRIHMPIPVVPPVLAFGGTGIKDQASDRRDDSAILLNLVVLLQVYVVSFGTARLEKEANHVVIHPKLNLSMAQEKLRNSHSRLEQKMCCK